MFIGITDTIPSEIFRNLNSSFFAVLHNFEAVSALERGKVTDDSNAAHDTAPFSRVLCITRNLANVALLFSMALSFPLTFMIFVTIAVSKLHNLFCLIAWNYCFQFDFG